MADSSTTVALNIGSQRITMGVFSTKGGNLVLQKYASANILADPAAEKVRLPQIKVAISELAERLKISKATKLHYAISGQSVFTRFVKLPPIDDGNIEQLIKFEAQQHVPFPLDEVIWDWQMLDSIDSSEKEIALVAIKKDALNEVNNTVIQAGFGTADVDASPMALYNALRFNYPDSEDTTLLIDIGAKTCNLIYLHGSRMFTRSVAMGGASVTTAIAKEYGVSFAEAEAQKVANGMVALNTVHTSQLDEPTAALATVIRNALGKLPAEIARTTNYFRSQHGGKAPRKVLLAGGGSNLPYLIDFFQDKLRLPVEFFNPLQAVAVGKGVDVDEVSTEAHLLGELVGLGLRGAKKAVLHIDLVPDIVAKERDIQSRKPMLLASSGVFLLGLVIWAWSNHAAKNRSQDELAAIKNKKSGLEKFHKPLVELKKKETTLDQISSQLVDAQQARVLWVDVYDDLARSFASDLIWLVDFDPVIGYDATNAATNIQSVAAGDFMRTSYSDSSLSKLKLPEQPRTGPNAKKAPEPVMITAVRVRGFWRDSNGFQDVYRVLEKLRSASVFFDVPPTEKAILSLSTRFEDNDYAAPFELILPLKKPVAAPLREGLR